MVSELNKQGVRLSKDPSSLIQEMVKPLQASKDQRLAVLLQQKLCLGQTQTSNSETDLKTVRNYSTCVNILSYLLQWKLYFEHAESQKKLQL